MNCAQRKVTEKRYSLLVVHNRIYRMILFNHLNIGISRNTKALATINHQKRAGGGKLVVTLADLSG